jgi:hypothetical protein
MVNKTNMETTETYLGRKVKEKHYFNVIGTFDSYYAASSWAKENGYAQGSMDGRNPIALMKGYDYIAKWHNISKEERQLVYGVMISDYFRKHPVTILIFE